MISVITEIELLSFTKLNLEQQIQLQQFIDTVKVIGIDTKIKNCTIDLRKKYRLKIPDALIVATALTYDAELFTNDIQLSRMPDLRCRMLKLQANHT